MNPMQIATTITGPCSCHEMYKGRGLVAPDCVYHELAREIADALVAARREGMLEAARIAENSEPDAGNFCEGAVKEHSAFIAYAIRHAAEE
jgi:hypothetical protein